MRYPILTRSKTESLARRLIAGEQPNWELERDWVGSGREIDLDPLRQVLQAAREVVDAADESVEKITPESIEGDFAGPVHLALRDQPVEALDDPGFWRFLSLVDFWWFIALREERSIGRGNVITYVDGGKECVPFRMFLRAQSIQDGEDYSLAGAIPRSADFWRSHVIRVKTGTAPPLARGFARLQAEKQMVSDDVRPYAKRINRMWTNVVFHDWTDDEADQLLGDMYDEMFGSEHNGSSEG